MQSVPTHARAERGRQAIDATAASRQRAMAERIDIRASLSRSAGARHRRAERGGGRRGPPPRRPHFGALARKLGAVAREGTYFTRMGSELWYWLLEVESWY